MYSLRRARVEGLKERLGKGERRGEGSSRYTKVGTAPVFAKFQDTCPAPCYFAVGVSDVSPVSRRQERFRRAVRRPRQERRDKLDKSGNAGATAPQAEDGGKCTRGALSGVIISLLRNAAIQVPCSNVCTSNAWNKVLAPLLRRRMQGVAEKRERRMVSLLSVSKVFSNRNVTRFFAHKSRFLSPILS